MKRLLSLTFSAALAWQAGCRPGIDHGRSAIHSNNQSSAAAQLSGPPALDACALALATPAGESRTDREIIQLQRVIPGSRDAAAFLERLGWMFVAKGRESFDPGF